MSQQPPPRPWFRLASLVRPTAPPPPAPTPAPAPAPATRPTFMRPTFTQTIAQPLQPPPPPPPAQPAPPPPQPPPPPLPASPTPPLQIPPLATTSPPSPAKPPPRLATTPPQTPPPPTMKPSYPSPKRSPLPPSTSSVLESPKPRSSAPSSPLPTRLVTPTPSPSPPPSKTAAASPSTTPVLVPRLPSPQIPSPKTKPLTPPPSPFTLPPPQLVLHSDHEDNAKIPPETEQKIVMVHDEAVEKAKAIPNENRYNHYSSPGFVKKEKGNYNNTRKKVSDSEDIRTRVITLAGENRGAIMEINPSQYPRNGHFATKNGDHNKSWSDSEKFTSDLEGKMKHKDKNHFAKTMPFQAYTNSNVQGVNNSIMYNCSCTHNDPGVHLSFSRKPKDPVHPHHV